MKPNIQGEKKQEIANPDIETDVNDELQEEIVDENDSEESDDETDDGTIDDFEETEDSDDTEDEIEEDISENTQEVADLEEEIEEEVIEDEVQPPEENAKYAAARRESEAKLMELERKQLEFAKSYGYDSFEELEVAQKAQKYVDEGHDEDTATKLVEHEELKARIARLEQDERINKEKAELKSSTFFNELEPEIDNFLKQDPNLSVKLIFNALRGERFDELMAEKTKEVKQQTLSNSKGKNHLKSAPKGNGKLNVPTVDDSEYEIYRSIAGSDAKSKSEYAKSRQEF